MDFRPCMVKYIVNLWEKSRHLSHNYTFAIFVVPPRICGAHLFSLLCCPMMYIYLLSSVLWCPLYFRIKHCSVGVYLQLFVGWLISYLVYLCLFAYSGIQHILCCVFRRRVYPMLEVSLDCPSFIDTSVFSKVFLWN